MTVKQYLAAGIIMLVAVLVFLFFTKDSSTQTSALLEPASLLSYKTPHKASTAPVKQAQQTPTTFQRPVITIDESAHPRWVNDIAHSSLRGTQVDRPQLEFDAQGFAKLKPTVLFYFDYFYNLSGEMAPERIDQLIYDDIYANFPEPAASQLYDLLQRYKDYSHAVDNALDGLESYQQAQAQGINKRYLEEDLRSQYFSNEEVDRLFNDYDKMLNFTTHNTVLNTKLQQYQAAKPDERYSKAIELFGEHGADGLQQFEQKQQQWQQRLEDYREQKGHISQANFDPAAEDNAIQALKDRLFSQTEQVRVRTWENFMQ